MRTNKILQRLIRQRRLSVPLIIIALLTACEAPVKSSGMIASEIPDALFPEDPSLLSAIGVGTVQGGKIDDLLARATISDDDLRTAIIRSLDRQGLLASDQPRYRLDVQLADAEQGLTELLFGLDITVVARIAYTLTDTQSNRPGSVERVESRGTTRSQDYFNQGERSRVAAERAIGNNIQEFLNRLFSRPATETSGQTFDQTSEPSE
jgi:hypothetical protein